MARRTTARAQRRTTPTTKVGDHIGKARLDGETNKQRARNAQLGDELIEIVALGRRHVQLDQSTVRLPMGIVNGLARHDRRIPSAARHTAPHNEARRTGVATASTNPRRQHAGDEPRRLAPEPGCRGCR